MKRPMEKEETLEKHFLVTVGERQGTLYGVRFVGGFFSQKEGLSLTLFYTAPRPPTIWEEEKDVESARGLSELEKEYEIKGRKALESARRELVRLGFQPGQIDSKLQTRRVSKAMDVIQEGEKGLYDAVVFGRRGLSWLEAAFDESVTAEILKNRVGFPVWICRSPEPDRRNVMICLDGSDAAQRAADHVGFVLGGQGAHGVTLTAATGNGASREDVDERFSRAREALLRGGVADGRITAKVLEGGNPGKVLLREAQEGGYAAVAAGRTGRGQGLLRRMFMGSVSGYLFRNLQGAALWVCH